MPTNKDWLVPIICSAFAGILIITHLAAVGCACGVVVLATTTTSTSTKRIMKFAEDTSSQMFLKLKIKLLFGIKANGVLPIYKKQFFSHNCCGSLKLR